LTGRHSAINSSAVENINIPRAGVGGWEFGPDGALRRPDIVARCRYQCVHRLLRLPPAKTVLMDIAKLRRQPATTLEASAKTRKMPILRTMGNKPAA
jgi:hypothetical protein